MVEKVNITLFKRFVLVSKVLPMVLAFCHFIHIILSYFYIDTTFINYFASISILTVAYLYLVNYVLKLCSYYRMFLHYCVIIDIFNVYDYYIGIPISDTSLLLFYGGVTIIIMFIILYIKVFK